MVEIRKLNCGLRVAIEKISYVQSATIGIWVKAGSVNENDSNHGISHFIEHMMFKGTKTRSARDIASDIDRIGGQINAFTAKENTCYYVRTLSSNFDKACNVLIDMLMNSVFDDTEMVKEKNVVYEEMKMVEDSPEDDVQDKMAEALFKGNDLSNSILGTPDSLAAITRDDMFRYVKEKYSLDNIVIAAAGNFDEDKLCSLFEEKMSALSPTREESTYKKDIYVPSFFNKTKDVEQTQICIATKALKFGEDDAYVLSVLNNVFGGSMSSRLFQNIREERGLAYSVYSFMGSYEHEGFFAISAGVAHEKAEETLSAIADELELLKTEGFSDDELLKSKEQLKGGLTFSLENTSNRMVSIGKNTLFLNRNRTPEEVLSLIDAVNLDDIRRIASMICDIHTYSGAIISRSEFDLKEMIQKAAN